MEMVEAERENRIRGVQASNSIIADSAVMISFFSRQ